MFLFHLLEDNCFTMLRWSLPHIDTSRLSLRTCPIPPGLPGCLHPSRSSHSTWLGSLLYPRSLPISHGSVRMQCYFLKLSYPLLPLQGPRDCSPCLCLHFFPVNRFSSTIFLDSIYVFVNIVYLVFSLSDWRHSV